MNETSWERVKEIFHEAVEYSGAERDAFIKKACGDDPAVLVEVRGLLASHDADEGLMKSPTFQGGEGRDADANSDAGLPGGALLEGPGTIVGRYKLLQEIGSGGFGVVYLAEQTEPVKRRVALKIIKLGMDTKQVIARFEAERQALAMMDHPNIARVLDAGATETGRPFFVMELVRGIPITDYCDKEKLNTRQRLDLFIKVCHAIQHAHQKGIIHRDIKPTNVLVTMHDDVPVPRVIDFGIAKATKAELTERTLFTEHGLMIGTPAYMSPEQAQMSDLDIDTRSDIYSLGVLLYELLTGTTPFSSKELREAGFGEIQRIIREEEPHKPSTRVSSLLAGAHGQTSLPMAPEGSESPGRDPSLPQSLATDIAKQRGTDPTSLTRLLRGDLDWIVMKALEKNRTRRYETATGLAMDIRRHLDHEPVLAGPPSASYRLRKLALKHRTLVGGVAALFVVLLCSVIVIGAMYRRAEDARQLALENQTLAQDREKEATEARDQLRVVVDFQSSMLSDIDAEQMGRSIINDLRNGIREVLKSSETSPGDIEITLANFDSSITGVNATNLALEMIYEHVLARAVEAIERDFLDQPLVRAALQQTVAATLLDLGLHNQALPLQEAALQIRRQRLGDEHPRTLQSRNKKAELLLAMGDAAAARDDIRDTLNARRRIFGDHHAETLESFNNLAGAQFALGEFGEATTYFREILEIRRQVLGDEHPDTLQSIHNLAVGLRALGRRAEAERYYREALAGYRGVFGDAHRDTLLVMRNFGSMLSSEGRYAEAEIHIREALTSSKRVLGDDHKQTLHSLKSLGTLLRAMGRYAEAETILRDVLERRRRVFGDENPDTLVSYSDLAILMGLMERYGEAELYGRQAWEGCREVLGGDHPRTIIMLGNVAGILLDLGDLAQAEPLMRQSLETHRRVFGIEHPGTLTAISNLGTLLLAMERMDEAEITLREALDAHRTVLGPDHPETLVCTYNLGSLLKSMDRYDEAEATYVDVIARQRLALGDDHPDTLMSIYALGRLLREVGRHEDSEALVAEVLTALGRQQPPLHPFRLAALFTHGMNLLSLERYADAELELLQAYDGIASVYANDDSRLRKAAEALVRLYDATDKPELAADWRAKVSQDESGDTDDAESGG